MAVSKYPYYDLVERAISAWQESTNIGSERARVLQEGIVDPQIDYEYGLPDLAPIPQDLRSIQFGEEDLRKGMLPENQFYREMGEEDMKRIRKSGKLVSSAFTVWQEKDGVQEGRFVISLNRLTKFYKHRYCRMEKAAEFAALVKQGDRMISFDIGWVPTPTPASEHGGLFRLQLQRKVLSVPCPSVWMGAFIILVHQISRSRHRSNQVLEMFGASVPGRCVGDPASMEGGYGERLRLGVKTNRSAFEFSGHYTPSFKGMLGKRGAGASPLGFHFRYHQDDVFHPRSEAREDQESLWQAVARSKVRSTVGFGPLPFQVLRVLNVSKSGSSACSLLQSGIVQVAKWEVERRRGEAAEEALGAIVSGLDALEEARPRRKTHAATTISIDNSFGCVRPWLGWNSFCNGWGRGWERRGERVPRHLDTDGPVPHNTVEGAQRYVANSGKGGRYGGRSRSLIERVDQHALLSGQQRMQIHCPKYVYCVRRSYAAITPPPTPPRSPASWVRRAVAPISGKSPRGSPQPDMGPDGLATQARRLALAEKLVLRRPYPPNLQISPSSDRAPNFPKENSNVGPSAGLGRRESTSVQSPFQYDLADAVQNSSRGRERASYSPRLAEPGVVSRSESFVQLMDTVGNASQHRPRRPKDDQHFLEDGGSGDQYAGTQAQHVRLRLPLRPPNESRIAQGAVLRDAVIRRLDSDLGSTKATAVASRLLRERRKTRTLDREATQLASFHEYMTKLDRSYPATAQDTAGWIGWLYESRLSEDGTSIAWKSLSGYMSDIRTALTSLGHPRIEDRTQSFVLDEVCKAYRDWDESKPLKGPVRLRIPSNVFRAVMEEGIRSDDAIIVRAAAMMIFARVHGLRSCSVEGAVSEGFSFSEHFTGWTSLITSLKGEAVQAASRRGARRFQASKVPGYTFSAVDHLKKWVDMRGNEKLLFGYGGSPPDLNKSVQIMLDHLGIHPPNGCVYSSHSCRIGAYTESLFFRQVSFDVLLSQFNWVALNMPKIYFDHRMVLSWEVELFSSKPAEFIPFSPGKSKAAVI